MIEYTVSEIYQLGSRYKTIVLILNNNGEYRRAEDRLSVLLDLEEYTSSYNEAYLQALWDKSPEMSPEMQTTTAIALAKESLSKGAQTSKTLWPVIQSFNEPLESLAKIGQLTLDNAYTSYREVFNGLPQNIKLLIVQYTNAHHSKAFSFTEPPVVTDAYKVEFNTALRDFLAYVTLRALI